MLTKKQHFICCGHNTQGSQAMVYGLWAVCGSFEDCSWLPGLQTNLSRLSSKHCKTTDASRKAFQSYRYCCLKLSYSPSGQVSVELEEFQVLCNTIAQLYDFHGNKLLNMRLLWLLQPKWLPTPGLWSLGALF